MGRMSLDKVNLQTGRFKYNDGGWYVGQHCGDGKRHGNGIYTYPNGDVFDGSFIMGKYVLTLARQHACTLQPRVHLQLDVYIVGSYSCLLLCAALSACLRWRGGRGGLMPRTRFSCIARKDEE